MFRQASNRCERVLETVNLAYASKRKESITSQKLGSQDFWRIANNVLSTKVNLLCLRYLTAWRCCLLHLIKQNCLLKTFLRTLILMTQVSLYLFSLNLKPHNISVTPKMAKKVITSPDLSKASGPDYIPVVLLKNYESLKFHTYYLNSSICV